MHRPGAVALLARLQADVVEIGIAEIAEEARRRRLRHPNHVGELGRGEGEDLVGAVEQQGGELLLARGQRLEPLLDAQRQTGAHPPQQPDDVFSICIFFVRDSFRTL